MVGPETPSPGLKKPWGPHHQAEPSAPRVTGSPDPQGRDREEFSGCPLSRTGLRPPPPPPQEAAAHFPHPELSGPQLAPFSPPLTLALANRALLSLIRPYDTSLVRAFEPVPGGLRSRPAMPWGHLWQPCRSRNLAGRALGCDLLWLVPCLGLPPVGVSWSSC